MSEVEEDTKTVEKEIQVSEPDMPVVPLFGKWDLTEVVINDTTLEKYINLDAFQIPHTGGRHSKKRFGRRDLTVIERFINNLMRTEKYTGKKAQAYNVMKNAFDIINSKKKTNPAQVMVQALENSAPRAAVISLRYGGIRVYSGVDVSPTRRVDTAIRNLCIGALQSAKKQRSIEKSLSRELMLASEGNPDSYAVGKKEELERQAEAAHN
jgi:small subunit ribosomal protein S7|tara:strand:- start:359 stop:988 length:630 start_codon:yes stop_codon:yes gene_type:complete